MPDEDYAMWLNILTRTELQLNNQISELSAMIGKVPLNRRDKLIGEINRLKDVMKGLKEFSYEVHHDRHNFEQIINSGKEIL